MIQPGLFSISIEHLRIQIFSHSLYRIQKCRFSNGILKINQNEIHHLWCEIIFQLGNY